MNPKSNPRLLTPAFIETSELWLECPGEPSLLPPRATASFDHEPHSWRSNEQLAIRIIVGFHRHGRLFERNGGNVLVLGENKSNGPQSVPPIQRLPGGVPTNSEGALPCNQHERFRTRPCRTKPKAHPCCLCGRRIRSFLFFRSRTMSSKIRRARHLDSLLPGIFDHSRAKSSIPRPVCHS